MIEKSVFAVNRIFFMVLLVCLAVMIIALLVCSKSESFLVLNRFHWQPLDYFFIVYTNVGDGLFSIALAIILFFYRRFLLGAEIILAFLLSGAIVQLLKFFFPMPRPRVFLAGSNYQHFIDQVTHTGYASFPSGHSASAFALATLLSLSDRNKKRSLLYLLAAVAVAYSRIYLGQHFLEDVFWGALDGFLSALLMWEMGQRWFVFRRKKMNPVTGNTK